MACLYCEKKESRYSASLAVFVEEVVVTEGISLARWADKEGVVACSQCRRVWLLEKGIKYGDPRDSSVAGLYEWEIRARLLDKDQGQILLDKRIEELPSVTEKLPPAFWDFYLEELGLSNPEICLGLRTHESLPEELATALGRWYKKKYPMAYQQEIEAVTGHFFHSFWSGEEEVRGIAFFDDDLLVFLSYSYESGKVSLRAMETTNGKMVWVLEDFKIKYSASPLMPSFFVQEGYLIVSGSEKEYPEDQYLRIPRLLMVISREGEILMESEVTWQAVEWGPFKETMLDITRSRIVHNCRVTLRDEKLYFPDGEGLVCYHLGCREVKWECGAEDVLFSGINYPMTGGNSFNPLLMGYVTLGPGGEPIEEESWHFETYPLDVFPGGLTLFQDGNLGIPGREERLKIREIITDPLFNGEVIMAPAEEQIYFLSLSGKILNEVNISINDTFEHYMEEAKPLLFNGMFLFLSSEALHLFDEKGQAVGQIPVEETPVALSVSAEHIIFVTVTGKYSFDAPLYRIKIFDNTLELLRELLVENYKKIAVSPNSSIACLVSEKVEKETIVLAPPEGYLDGLD